MDLADLESLVRANRNDRDLRKLYTDRLVEKGDPRGEWASICELLSIEAPLGGHRNGLSQDDLLKQKRVLEERHPEWWGELVHERIDWIAGYFDHVELSSPGLLRPVLQLESSRFLRSLAVDVEETFLPEVSDDLHARCDVLLELELRAKGRDLARMDLTMFSSLVSARLPLGDWTVTLPRSLRSLSVTGEGALSKNAATSLGNACRALPSLRSLTIDLGETWRPIERGDLAPILALATSGLTRLSLRRTTLCGEILRALAAVGPLSLETLHLGGTFSGDDLRLARLPIFSQIEMDLRPTGTHGSP